MLKRNFRETLGVSCTGWDEKGRSDLQRVRNLAGSCEGTKRKVRCKPFKTIKKLGERVGANGVSLGIRINDDERGQHDVNGPGERVSELHIGTRNARLVHITVRRPVLSLCGLKVWLGALTNVVHATSCSVSAKGKELGI